jgi:hypothetical protein
MPTYTNTTQYFLKARYSIEVPIFGTLVGTPTVSNPGSVTMTNIQLGTIGSDGVGTLTAGTVSAIPFTFGPCLEGTMIAVKARANLPTQSAAAIAAGTGNDDLYYQGTLSWVSTVGNTYQAILQNGVECPEDSINVWPYAGTQKGII